MFHRKASGGTFSVGEVGHDGTEKCPVRRKHGPAVEGPAIHGEAGEDGRASAIALDVRVVVIDHMNTGVDIDRALRWALRPVTPVMLARPLDHLLAVDQNKRGVDRYRRKFQMLRLVRRKPALEMEKEIGLRSETMAALKNTWDHGAAVDRRAFAPGIEHVLQRVDRPAVARARFDPHAGALVGQMQGRPARAKIDMIAFGTGGRIEKQRYRLTGRGPKHIRPNRHARVGEDPDGKAVPAGIRHVKAYLR